MHMFTKITHKNVYGSFICSNSKLETMQIPTNRRVDKLLTIYVSMDYYRGKNKPQKLATNVSHKITKSHRY